jgi:hypothetical protein
MSSSREGRSALVPGQVEVRQDGGVADAELAAGPLGAPVTGARGATLRTSQLRVRRSIIEALRRPGVVARALEGRRDPDRLLVVEAAGFAGEDAARAVDKQDADRVSAA